MPLETLKILDSKFDLYLKSFSNSINENEKNTNVLFENYSKLLNQAFLEKNLTEDQRETINNHKKFVFHKLKEKEKINLFG